jgi:hypothetical protein
MRASFLSSAEVRRNASFYVNNVIRCYLALVSAGRRYMLSIRNGPMALSLLAALIFSACSGGSGGVASSGVPQGPPSSFFSTTATRTYRLGSATGSYDLPPLGGFSGSLAVPATTVPADTRLELTSSLQAPVGAPVLDDAGRSPQATGTLNIYFYTTIYLSNTVTFPTLPGFSVTLPMSVNSTGLQFFYAISDPKPANSAKAQFRTEGPAATSGQTVTFAPTTTSLTLKANQAYTIAFYAVSAIAKPSSTPRGKIYVANSGDNTVTTYAADGTPATPTITGLNSPAALAVDAAGKIYVLNQGNDTVTTYTANGTQTTPTITGLSNGPQGVAVDAAGKIYVSNHAGGNDGYGSVTAYTANGTQTTPTIMAGLNFSGGMAVDASGKIYVANYYGGVTTYNANGTQTTQTIPVDGSTSVAVDPTGKIICVGSIFKVLLRLPDYGSVSCYTANGTPTTQMIGGFGYPQVSGVSVDAADKIYVAIPGSNTVTTYTSDGTPTTPTITGLNHPVGIAVHP